VTREQKEEIRERFKAADEVIATAKMDVWKLSEAYKVATSQQDIPELLDALESETVRAEKAEGKLFKVSVSCLNENGIKMAICKEREQWKALAEVAETKIAALERAVHGHCFSCVNAKPPEIKTLSGFPNIIACEHIVGAVATTGVSFRPCEHWQFDTERFDTE